MSQTNKHNQHQEAPLSSSAQGEQSKSKKSKFSQAVSLLELLNTLTSDISALIAAIDVDYRYIHFNPPYRDEVRRLFGVDLETGMTVMDVYRERPEQLAFALKQWNRSLGGELFKEVVRFLRTETKENFYEVTYSPIKNNKGLITGAVIVSKNITQRLVEEHFLTESEMRYQQLFDNILDGLAICEFLFDEKGQPIDYRILDVNPKFTSMIGSEREQLIGSNYSVLTPFLGNFELDRLSPLVFASETVHFEEFSPVSQRYYDGFVYSLPKNCFVIILTDITERNFAESNTSWLASFPEQNPMPVLEIDYDCIITYQNPAAITFFSDSRGSDQSHLFLFQIDDIMNIFKTGEDTKASKDIQIGDTWLHLSFYHMPQRKRIRIYSVDISDRVIAEKDLLDLNRKLEETVQLRTEALNRLNQELKEDIQCRKNSEKALEAEHKRFNDVLEMLPVYIILLTPDGHIKFANKFFKDSLRMSSQVRGDELASYRNKPKEVVETFKPLQSGQSNIWEWSGPENCIYTIHDFPFSDVDGSPLILEMGVEITEIRNAQKNLQETANYNRSLIDANLDFLVTINKEGIIEDVNTAAQLATGLSREELIGSCFETHFENREAASRGIQLVLETGSVRNYELSIKHKDGHTTPVAYNASFFTNSEGKVSGIFAGAREITELKRKEEEMLELNRDLEEAIAHELAIRNQLIQAEKFSAMGRMLASVTHEINNPLQTITNCQYLLASDIPVGSQARQFLEMAMSETTRISKLVADLKDVYRPHQENDFATVYLPALLDKIGSLLKPQLTEKHVEWVLIGDHDNKEEMWVEGIEDQLKQVAINLSLNAIDAMQPRGGLLQVALVDGQNNEIGILFSDTGPGIETENLSKIFEPFFSTKKQGLGLGLSICYEIIQRHNGHIEVSSIPGKGTKFEVWLPGFKGQKSPER